MLRRQPTRLEMKPEDIEDFDKYMAQHKQDKGHEEKKDTAARIGLRPHANRSESPEY